MTKKGFTLMELLVSIFITGMVMLSLVAMWRTSSNHTAQAQRQSIIKNDSTIFLRKLYSDFVFASDVICPWGYTGSTPCSHNNEYIALKNAVIDYSNISSPKILRTTAPVCGTSNNQWLEGLDGMTGHCIKPSYVIYVYDADNHMVYRCTNNFLETTSNMLISTLISTAHNYCSNESNREVVMPYVSGFSITSGDDMVAKYEIRRNFGQDIPDVYFRVSHILPTRRGI